MKRAARNRDKTPVSVLSSIMNINPASARTAPVIVESLNVLSFEMFSPIAGYFKRETVIGCPLTAETE